jgi:AraC-like DNA-binding protein
LQFDQAFLQKSLRLEIDKLEATCARWLGHPLERPLQFALRPFSDALERVWRQTLLYTGSDEMGGSALSGAAKESLDEYLRTLLLHQHAHNYSEELADPSPTPLPGLVRRAERYIAENAGSAITLPDVAAALGVSVRTLQNGFRQWRDTTPHEFLRQTRLRLVHDELSRSGEDADVTTVALRHGAFQRLLPIGFRRASQHDAETAPPAASAGQGHGLAHLRAHRLDHRRHAG